jgi:hypothetical protein
MPWLLLFLLLTPDPPAPSEGPGAKAIFKNPSLNTLSFSPRNEEKPSREKPPAEPKKKKPQPPAAPVGDKPQDPAPISIGVRFWVQRVDAQGAVLDEMEVGHIFRSGDRIQLVLESNTDGYLAIVQHGSDGRAGLLLPRHESELGTNRLTAHTKIVLPDARHSFSFDHNVGTERLLVILSRDREELAALPLRREMGAEDLAVLRRLSAQERGAKNLIIEGFVDPEEDPSTYVVNRTGNAIIQEIALVHEK